jgi:predicted metal-dependent enzyme (double-stranded beta helix superfamily)
MLFHHTLSPVRSSLAVPLASKAGRVRDTDLAELTRRLASVDELWREIVQHDPQSRWYERILLTDDVEVWLIGWSPGQSTSIHDHGGSTGALSVVEGTLTEDWYAAAPSGIPHPVARRVHARGATQSFPADHIHRVGNTSAQLATSVHAYSPPGVALREYATAISDLSSFAEAS